MNYYISVAPGLLDKKHIEKMGGSPVFLFLWLICKVTKLKEDGTGDVLGRMPVTYEMVKADLGISRATYKRWLNALRDEGYINTTRTPKGLTIGLNKAQKMFGLKAVEKSKSDGSHLDSDGSHLYPRRLTLEPSNIRQVSDINKDKEINNKEKSLKPVDKNDPGYKKFLEKRKELKDRLT